MTIPNPRPSYLCQYPECDQGPIWDLCDEHSTAWGRIPRRHRDHNLIENEGIFDWTAVDVAARGLRPVRLTWVEREVAAITLYARGFTPPAIAERLGRPIAKSRWGRIKEMVGTEHERNRIHQELVDA